MNYEIAITTFVLTLPIGTAIGYFIRVCIEDKIIRRRDKDKRHIEAYISLAQAFMPALHRLDDQRQSSHVIIHDDFIKHRDAMLKFIAFIEDGKRKDRFKAKWTEYEKTYEKMKNSEFWDTDNTGENAPLSAGCLSSMVDCNINKTELEKDTANKEKLKQLIYELLKIAKH